MRNLNHQTAVCHLVIFFDPAKTVGKFLKIKYLSESRYGTRTSRPGLIQKKTPNSYLCMFFSTKSYSNLVFNVLECCPLGNTKRIIKNENRIMVIDSRTTFELPSGLIDQWKKKGKIKIVASCFFDLEAWSDKCVKRV